MTEHRRTSPSGVRIAAWVAAAVVIAAVLFAPVLTSGYCAVAPASGESYCGSASRSILGIDTSLWLWVAATLGLGALAWWLARRPRRDR
jgi:hypothetical protein